MTVSDAGRRGTGDPRRSRLSLSAVEAIDFAADLVQRRAGALVDAGRYEEAIGVYDEEARGYRALLGGATGVPPDPGTARRQGLHLGKALMEIGTLSARLHRTDDALALTDDAVGVVRALGPIDSVLGAYVLARVLWGFAWVRAGLAVELRPALAAAQEAEGVLRGLAQDPHGALASSVRTDLPVLQAFVAHLTERVSPGLPR